MTCREGGVPPDRKDTPYSTRLPAFSRFPVLSLQPLRFRITFGLQSDRKQQIGNPSVPAWMTELQKLMTEFRQACRQEQEIYVDCSAPDLLPQESMCWN